MCMTIEEMNTTMAEIQEWKRIKEEAEDNISAPNAKAIEFLRETETCEAVDKKGNPIRRFIGNIFKATLSEQSRETVDKAEVRKLLDDEEYEKVRKVSTFQVLRIS